MLNFTNEIDKTTENFIELFGALTVEELHWRPTPETWSIAQNIDHLIAINATYFPILAKLKAGTYETTFLAKIGFAVSFLGKTVLNAVQPDRRKRIKTFPIWEPTTDQIAGDILGKFKEHQLELKRQIETSRDCIKEGAIISSPANRNIVYKLETAFEIIIAHEQRHLEQAKEVLELIRKNLHH